MLKIEITSQRPSDKTDHILAWIDLGDGRLADPASFKNHPGKADLERRRKAGEIGGAYLTTSSPALLYLPGKAAKHYPDHEKIKILAAQALAAASDRRAASLVIALEGPDGAAAAALAAEGMALHDYDFTKYRKGGSKKHTPAISIVVPESGRKQAQADVKRALEICESVNRARDLVNEPGSVGTPAEIEARARSVAEKSGLKITVLDAKQLKKEGYEGLLAVGRGGAVPPRMIVMEYTPAGGAKGKKKLGLLGKGVTFDTGGVSIKPAGKMWEMKGDMAGAAAVLYAMEAIARLKPKMPITGIIVTAQNYLDANAIVPGDIIKGRNGKFIHVDNTDAEGRLILTDGLWRAGEEKVTHLIDFATLTGAIVRAIGTSLNGAFGNDDLVDKFVEVARSCGEDCWKMPIYDEYIDMLKCDVADINNVSGKPEGGAITAALFLREFLPEGISWTHMDIAGTFLVNSKWKYYRPGATGVMVRSIVAFAQAMADGKLD